jgi:hypothetical protein
MQGRPGGEALLPIVRSVGSVRRTRRIIEANLARDGGAKRYAQSLSRYHSIAILAQRVGWTGRVPDARLRAANLILGAQMKSAWARIICRLLIVLMVWTPYQVAQAGMIGTDQATAASSQADRAAVLSFVSRADVAGELQSMGLDAATAKDRVAALTDAEVAYLAGRIERLPAGADSAGVILLILIIAAIWWVWKR